MCGFKLLSFDMLRLRLSGGLGVSSFDAQVVVLSFDVAEGFFEL